ncbi:hypothetical protein NEMBOFW57_009276 [Staphylotrichum longicolle]|uniref:Azaphilone pigments biosynthesis cluster protein L N-terminal domain-containing protein n=1 Tax=Staphylotrichum longicolle TaxID=669026 RepID=A0AAD4ENT4_9PEZI|nr:hypothetical protein NEMBOFW57_009276 [Staphylotrichum longicolle]
MDPLSITASAVALAASVLRAALFIKDTVDQFQDAPALARDMQDEITIVQAALLQVEAVLQRDHQAIRRFRLQHVFDLSVEGCCDALCHISEELEGLFDRHDWRASFVLWWNAGDIRRWFARLETKKGSLALLVQALNLHSVQEMQELLQQNMATLELARFGLDDMVPSYPACTAGEWDTVASAVGSDASVFGDRESVVSNTRFAFDTICFDSKAYRHTVARVSAKKKKKSNQATATDAAAAKLHDMDLQPVQEAESDEQSSAPTARPTPRPTITTEEHEAVLMKLREAEALIQTLQERIEQPKPFVAAQEAEALDQGPTSGVIEEVAPAKFETLKTATSMAAELDEKSSDSTRTAYSLPEDGRPITIRPAGKPARPMNASQTSLLIEYFESARKLENPRLGKPSLRVRVTPRKDRKEQEPSDRIRVTPRRDRKSEDQGPGFIRIPTTRDRLRVERKQSASQGSAPGKQTGAEAEAAIVNSISAIPPSWMLDRTDAGDRPPRTRRTVKADLEKLSKVDVNAAGPTGSVTKDQIETPGDVRRPRNSAVNNPKLLETVEDAIRRLILPELELQRAKQQRSLGITGSRTGCQGVGSPVLKTNVGLLATDTMKERGRVPLKDATNLEREGLTVRKTIRPEKARRKNPTRRRISTDGRLTKSDDEGEGISRSPAPAPRRPSGLRREYLIPPINLPNPLEEHEETGKSVRSTPHSPLPDAPRSISLDPRGPSSPRPGTKDSCTTAPPLPSAQRDDGLAPDVSLLSPNKSHVIEGAEETGRPLHQPAPLPALNAGKAILQDTSIDFKDATAPDFEDISLASGNKGDKIESTGLSAHPAQSSTDPDTKKVNDGLKQSDRRTLGIDTNRIIAEINRATEELIEARLQRPLHIEAVERAIHKESRLRRALKGWVQSKNGADLANVEAVLAQLLDQVQEVKQQTQPREGHVVGDA